MLSFLHYLDDFAGASPPEFGPGPSPSKADFSRILELCKVLGIPLASDKTEFPSTLMIFLGFLIDTVNLTVSLPEEKRLSYLESIAKVMGKRSILCSELESLIGKLMHATEVIPIGRAFFRSLYDKVERRPKHIRSKTWISLGADERLNLRWWQDLLRSWNGISLMRFVDWRPVFDLELASDAALTDGYGIVVGNEWIAGKWPEDAPKNIAILEAIPLVLVSLIWGYKWKGKCILFHTDNMAVKLSATSLLPKDPHLVFLMRELAMNSVRYDFRFEVEHVPGTDNTLADLLSRSRFDEFFALHPNANPYPVNFDVDGLLKRLINYKAK